MGGQIALSGPDFGASIPELSDGGKVQGHFQGQPLVAVRRGDEYFVVAAACTHWGENLADGAVIGDTIRCGGHHGCFSLRTGEASCPPALGALQTYEVERRGAVRVVVGPRKQAPAPRRVNGSDPSSVVIVGGGAAGSAAADLLRREGYAGPVTLISADPDLPCDRPNVSKDYLAGTAPEEWLFVRDAAAWKAAEIELRLGTRVEAIDRAARAVRLSTGVTLRYGALLLAPGAEAVRLPIPGAELPHVHVLRTVSDARRIVAGLSSARRAVVVGASFIGMEAAASLRARGLDVQVVAPDAVPFSRSLGPVAGGVLKAVHERAGVKFQLGRRPARISASEVTLDDGTAIPADLVVLGVGVRPSLALAEAAGLAVDRGVTVDAQLRTSDPHIWAAGDIARYPDSRGGAPVRIEHWVVAQRQGQAAARAMLGDQTPFAAVPFFWTTQFGVTLRYVGHAESWERIDVTGEPSQGDCAFAYRAKGRTLAVVTYGRQQVSLEAEDALERGDEAALARLVPTGSPS